MKILVVDDDQAVRESLRRSLTFNGYEVELAGDGVEAVEHIDEDRPDAVILDVMMPGLSGLDVLRRLRDGEGPEGCRVILLTARARDSEVDSGFAAGADDYVIKPFSPRELLRRVDALLDRH